MLSVPPQTEQESLSQRAQAAAAVAQKAAAVAFDQRVLYNTLRTDMGAGMEANPMYLGKSRVQDSLRAQLHFSFRTCDTLNHKTRGSPFLFVDNHLGTFVSSHTTARFQARLRYVEQFRMGSAYLKGKVSRAREAQYDEQLLTA